MSGVLAKDRNLLLKMWEGRRFDNLPQVSDLLEV
jgi:hypothetical protein